MFILGFGGLILTGCSSSRTGYTYYDDVYENRPSYAENRKRSSSIDDRPVYQQSSGAGYSQNGSGSYDNSRYIDDEQQNAYGTYTERIRRFHSPNTGFDYYSPYYTGYNDGFNYGIGVSTGYGFSNFGGWGSSFGNPWYSSSLYFGWGRPSWSIGFNNWGYYDPFWGNNWGWGRPWYNSYYGGGWGSPWGWGGNTIIIRNDRNPRNSNMHYGPRTGSYGNQYYNGQQYQGGGRMNNSRGSNYGTPQNPGNSGGNMRYTPKNNTQQVPPAATPSPNRTQPQQNRQNVPSRYNQPSPSYSNPSPQRSAPSSSPGRSGGNSGGSQQRSGGSMQRTNK